MQTEYRREIRFDEIIIDLDHKHIYGYRNGDAVEIVEPNAFNYHESRAYIKRRMSHEKGWLQTHSSEYEERFLKVGVSND